MKQFLLALVAVSLALPAYAQSTLYSNSTTGNVGIGTTSPQALLHIYGGQVDLSNNAVMTEIANAGTTGTTVNKLAKLTGAPSTAILTATTDKGGVVGIAIGGAGTSGNAQIATIGQASCVFENATVAGDYVQIGSTTAGDCHDAGATYPPSGQVLGRVLSTNTASSTPRAMVLFGPEISPPALASSDIWVGNGSSVPTAVAMSGDCTIANTGAITCTKTNGTGFGALATLSSVNLSSQATGTLQAAQFPAQTGDVTTTAGGLATTVAAIQGTTVSGTTGTGSAVFSASPNLTGIVAGASSNWSGNVGIGTTAPSTPLTVNGTVQSLSGGFQFPDGTTQTTAAIVGFSSCTTVSGSGTATCAAGYTLTGGGCGFSINVTGSSVGSLGSAPSGNSWVCSGSSAVSAGTVYAVCCH